HGYRKPEDCVRSILTLALVLIAIWIVAKIVFGLVGFMVHVLLCVGAVLFIIWLWRLLTGRNGTTDTTPRHSTSYGSPAVAASPAASGPCAPGGAAALAARQRTPPPPGPDR